MLALFMGCNRPAVRIPQTQAVAADPSYDSPLVVGWQEGKDSIEISADMKNFMESVGGAMIVFVSRDGTVRITDTSGREITPCGSLYDKTFQEIVKEGKCQDLDMTRIENLSSELTIVHSGSVCITKRIGGYLIQICK